MPTIEVNLISGSNLIGADYDGTSDPYCVLTVGNASTSSSKEVSSVQQSTLNPDWDEDFTLHVTDPMSENLHIHVRDKDQIGSDDSLGEAYIPLNDLVRGMEREYNVQLQGGEIGENILAHATSFLTKMISGGSGPSAPVKNNGVIKLTIKALDFGNGGGFQQGGFPPQQQYNGGFQQGGFPPQQGGFPPQQQMYNTGGFPPQQQQYNTGGFPPQQQMYNTGGFPPQQQGGFPPQQQAPPQQMYNTGGYPPQQPQQYNTGFQQKQLPQQQMYNSNNQYPPQNPNNNQYNTGFQQQQQQAPQQMFNSNSQYPPQNPGPAAYSSFMGLK